LYAAVIKAVPSQCQHTYLIKLLVLTLVLRMPLPLSPADTLVMTSSHHSTLTRNIRERRGEKVNIRIPLHRDTNTTGCTK
jgi:hypothetical protein